LPLNRDWVERKRDRERERERERERPESCYHFLSSRRQLCSNTPLNFGTKASFLGVVIMKEREREEERERE
jgi:hypothetical protein